MIYKMILIYLCSVDVTLNTNRTDSLYHALSLRSCGALEHSLCVGLRLCPMHNGCLFVVLYRWWGGWGWRIFVRRYWRSDARRRRRRGSKRVVVWRLVHVDTWSAASHIRISVRVLFTKCVRFSSRGRIKTEPGLTADSSTSPCVSVGTILLSARESLLLRSNVYINFSI